MTQSRLSIAITISFVLHLALLTLWWQAQDSMVISSPDNGTPLNISIVQAEARAKPKTVKQTRTDRRAQPDISVTQKSRRKIAVPAEPEADTVRDMITPEKTFTTSLQPTKRSQQQAYALLNNNMIDYLSSEFKLRFKYPLLARKRGWQGEVLLALDINPRGKIAQVMIQRSSGYKVLDRNAVRTFERIGELSPELKSSLAREHRLSIPVVYKLTDS